MPDADAFFGEITPGLLAVADDLRWVQAPIASLETYAFPEWIERPCTLTKVRGLFSEVIAEHVFVPPHMRNDLYRQSGLASRMPFPVERTVIRHLTWDGMILCLTRNRHHYLRQQTQSVWQPRGGGPTRVSFSIGLAPVWAMDHGHPTLAGKAIEIVGMGSIGR